MITQSPRKPARQFCGFPSPGTVFQVLPDDTGVLQVIRITTSPEQSGLSLYEPLEILLPPPALGVIRDLITEATHPGETLSGYVPCGQNGSDIRVIITRLSDGTVSVIWGDQVSPTGYASIHQGYSAAPDVISRHDREFTFGSSTPSAVSLFGFRPSELNGTSLLSYIHPEDLSRVKSSCQPLLSGPGVCRIRYRLKNNQGDYHWVESVFTSTFRSDGTFAVMMASTREMDTIVRAELAARGANAKLNLLNGIIRHDIMNQLTGLIGYLDILSELVEGTDAQMLISKEQNIVANIKSLIDFTRDYQGIGLSPPDFIDVDAVVYKVLSRNQFTGKITSRRSLAGLSMYVDRMFEQVIFEIVSNSLTYGGEHVEINFRYNITDQGLTLIVEDNGPGIPDNEKEHIFSRSDKNRYGRGLYMATTILDITGIQIRETGTAGQGARFEILVPRDGYRLIPS